MIDEGWMQGLSQFLDFASGKILQPVWCFPSPNNSLVVIQFTFHTTH